MYGKPIHWVHKLSLFLRFLFTPSSTTTHVVSATSHYPFAKTNWWAVSSDALPGKAGVPLKTPLTIFSYALVSYNNNNKGENKKKIPWWMAHVATLSGYLFSYFFFPLAPPLHSIWPPQGKVFFSSSSVSTIWQCMVICTWYVPPSPGTLVVQLLPAQKVKSINPNRDKYSPHTLPSLPGVGQGGDVIWNVSLLFKQLIFIIYA